MHIISRLFRHLFSTPWHLHKHFPADLLKRIELAIQQSETMHSGQIRFVVESDLHPVEIIRSKQPRHRAVELFSQLRIWDTEHNNGVLIYLLLADHDVEIVADRGIHNQVGKEQWEAICKQMEAAFRQHQFEQGVLLGIEQISLLLQQYFPGNSNNPDELPDAPLVL